LTSRQLELLRWRSSAAIDRSAAIYRKEAVVSLPLRFAVIVASTRVGRFADVVADWFVEQAEQHGTADVEVVDLASFELPHRFSTRPTPVTEALSSRLAAADAFVIVTPEYNHSFPASIKQAIDVTDREWYAKPVAFVSYGGISGGLRAVEQLRVVLAELHATTIRDTVSFHGVSASFDPDGRPTDPAGPSAAAKQLLDRLTWWADALRSARNRRPYAA
jgi:NAD(P)H-dependent FMN reductase